MVRGGDKKGRPEYVSWSNFQGEGSSEAAFFNYTCRSAYRKSIILLVTRRKMFDLAVGML